MCSGNDRESAESARKHGNMGHGVRLCAQPCCYASAEFHKKIAEIKEECSHGFSSGNEEVLPAGKTAWENAGRHLQIYQAVRRAGTADSWGASEDLAERDHLAVNSLGSVQ